MNWGHLKMLPPNLTLMKTPPKNSAQSNTRTFEHPQAEPLKE
jgi:hypothetical protein